MAAEQQPSTQYAPFVVIVKLNGVDRGSVLVLRGSGGEFYFQDLDLAQWGVCHADDPGVHYHGNAYHPFGGDAQKLFTYDSAQQTLEVNLPPSCFEPTRINLAHHASPLTPGSPGLFLNYDFFASGQHTRSQGQDNLSGQFETVAFNRFGSLSLDALAPDIVQHNSSAAPVGEHALILLDSTFTHDNADDMTRWEVGDAISGSGIWGRPVRFAGVRYSRDFETRPGFVTQPLPSLTGTAALPSTVEVYLNGVLSTRQQVQPGPFQINDLPTFGNGGNVQLVVRDLLGREVVTSLPFITGAALLHQGLTDFSIETGTLRENFGSQSFDYDAGFASATVRHGLSDTLTLEGRTELQKNQYTSGIGASCVVPGVPYVMTSAIAGSSARSGSGHQETLSFQPGSAIPVSLTASVQLNSMHFVQLGTSSAQLPPHYTAAASLSFMTLKPFVVTVSQVRNAPRGEPGSVVNSLSLDRRIGRVGTLALSVFDSQSGLRNQGLLLTFSTNVGKGDSLLNTSNWQRGTTGPSQSNLQSEFDHPPTSELGYGWDVRVIRDSALDSSSSTQGGMGGIYQGRLLSLTAQFDRGIDRTDYQADLSGGLGILGGKPFASRRIFDSVGLAVAPDLPNLPVYVENQLAGYTDAHGKVLLPRLIEYTDNKISIDSTDLPLDTELTGPDSVVVAPYHRSGVVVALPVRRVHGAVVILRQEDGALVPPGALASIAQDERPHGAASAPPPTEAYVADRGEVYLPHVVEHDNHLLVRWGEHRCETHFDLPASAQIQPRIGPLACRAIP